MAPIDTIEEAAPTKRAPPNGPGERPRAPARSARSTAKHPQKSPKKPKAPSSSTSDPFQLVFVRKPPLPYRPPVAGMVDCCAPGHKYLPESGILTLG